MRLAATATATAAALTAALLITPSSSTASQDSAAPPAPNQMVSEVPSSMPPIVAGGSVRAIAAVGSKMVIGGPITAVGGQARDGIATFDATTGALTTTFNPSLNGSVTSLLPGPTADTVYVGGSFTSVNGQTARRVALLNTTTGALVPSFSSPAINAVVEDLYKVGNRLYIGGGFSKVSGQPRGGLASLNATTGDFDPFLDVQLTIRHNAGVNGAATAAVGASALDVSPDGSTMVVIGNFRKADALDRVQVALIDLTGASAEVRADWRTTGYEPACYNGAYDTYMRGVSYSPGGGFFVISTTGGGNNTLCDTIARWESNASGQNVQPTWVNQAGGDTLWATTVTTNAVYVGGHQRWLNNPYGNDYAGPGSVPRAGLAALDPASGRPLAWNPGRNPRGTAVYAMLATDQGLWIGHNTQWIGNRKYRRANLAFFPYAGGATLASTTTPTLPAKVFVGAGDQSGTTNVLYRVNAGGNALGSMDSGPDWVDDSGVGSAYRNIGSNAAAYGTVPTLTGNVPASTPRELYSSERWDPAGGEELRWDFPVAPGTPLQVRIYVANRCDCTSAGGQRRFDIDVDGVRRVSNLDLSGQFGHNVGTMLAYNVTSDGNVDIDFGHVLENPLLNGIEIVRTDVTPSPSGGSLTVRDFNGTTASAATPVTSNVEWQNTRGAFTVGDQVFIGKNDGLLYRAPLNGGTQLGALSVVQPYHDPAWMNIKTGSGNSTFDGANPDFYGEISQIGGMFYADGRIYYNRVGSAGLRWVWFSPDSGIVDGRGFTATSSVSFANVSGMFATGGFLYYVNRTTGDMYRVAFAGGVVSGVPTLVNGPLNGGADWRGRALFLGNPAANQLPTASFSSMCENTACTFDGSASADPDGSIATYAWNFGDGSPVTTTSGSTTQHTFPAATSYTVTLTVTDNRGGQRGTSAGVSPALAPAGTGFVAADASSDSRQATKSVDLPAATQAGDLMLLSYVGNTDVPPTPSGWTLVESVTNGALNTTSWSRTASAGDLGGTASFTQSSSQKAIALLAVYRGFSTVATLTSADDANMATHSAPAVGVTSGDQVVSLFTDKSSTTTSWSVTGGLTERLQMIGSGNGRYSVELADRASRTSTGTFPSQTATTDAPSGKALAFNIVLRP